jgi:hypothetical protein
MKTSDFNTRLAPRTCLSGLLLLLTAAAALGQNTGDTAPPATPGGKSLAASAGVFAYPMKNQTSGQQAKDEGECYNWTKTQTGWDPMQPPPKQTTQQPAQEASQPDRARARGAVRGAAGGAAIGAIAGDAGQGAAIGAVAGVMAGGRQSRITQAQQQQQAQQTQQQTAAQAEAAQTELQNTFKRGMSACLEARGYSVK